MKISEKSAHELEANIHVPDKLYKTSHIRWIKPNGSVCAHWPAAVRHNDQPRCCYAPEKRHKKSNNNWCSARQQISNEPKTQLICAYVHFAFFSRCDVNGVLDRDSCTLWHNAKYERKGFFGAVVRFFRARFAPQDAVCAQSIVECKRYASSTFICRTR